MTKNHHNPDLNLRYRRLFETAHDGILIINFDDGRIQDVNPYLITMLGYTKHELVGKQLWQIGAMVNKNASMTAFGVLKQDGYIKYDDLPLRTKDGQIISVEFLSNTYDVDGESIIQCNIRDITNRKNALTTMKRYQQSLSMSMVQIVGALTKVIVARDAYTHQHQVRVSDLCVAIDMGHLAQSGPGGMIEALAAYPNKRRILIHINNTNPILREDSAQALQLQALGIEVAFDGMHIEV